MPALIAPLGECRHAHLLKHGMGLAQLCSRLTAPPVPAQPLPVQQMSACELRPDADPAQARDRLQVQASRLIADGKQRM